MPTPSFPAETSTRMVLLGWRADWLRWMGGAILVAGAIAVYWRTFSVPLLFDDACIADDPSIRHWSTALWPSNNSGAAGRPILNLSLAINYAISGTAVWSYHALNLAIHILAGLTLFGIVRRTLAARASPAASLVAFSAALLWSLHPLQTESVTFTIQRTESLMGFFYLLTLYWFIRGGEADHRAQTRWFALTVATCLLGMATKEVMVSAPLMVLLYDRTFVAGSFRAAWQRRRALYLGLACTWVLLAAVMLGSQKRGGTVGFGLGVSPWEYSLTQCRAIVLYLKLSVWPHPLVVDYGTALIRNALAVWPQALLLILLVAGTLLSLWRGPALGFVGAWFFAILAPSSSMVPLVTQTVAEHRMYLPLAAVMTLVVLGIHAAVGRKSGAVFALLALGLGLLTARRNEDYRSELTIWKDTVAKQPNNERAHTNLGAILSRMPGRLNDAIAQYEAALRLQPDYAEAHNNLGLAWSHLPGRLNDAIAQYQEALRLKPDLAEAHNNLGVAWAHLPGRLKDAMARLEEAVRLQPDYAEAHNNLGLAWSQVPGRLDDAVAQYQEALRLQPDFAEAHYNLGLAWSQMPGRMNDAIAQYEEALRLQPDYAEAHNNLGAIWAQMPGRLQDAIARFEGALRLKPDYAEAHNNLGLAWSQLSGRLKDAIAQYEEALRLKPDYAEAHYNLGDVWSQTPGRLDDAVAQYQEVLRLKPDFAEAHHNLGVAWSRMPGRLDDAVAEYQAALRLKPDFAEAHTNLGLAWSRMPGRRKDAVAEYKEALRLRPDYAPAWHNLGTSLFYLGDLPGAAAAFREELRLSPNDPAAQQALAAVLQQTGGH
jgi:tetratricopeptide (TPR) repeat protein